MKKVIAAVILMLMTTFSAFAQGDPPKNLLVMGWDGAGLINVKRLLSEGKLPNLQNFLGSGASLVPLELTHRTNTLTSWTQVFTGLTPDQTGVMGNNPITKFRTRDYGSFNVSKGSLMNLNFWVTNIPYEHTILSRIQGLGYKIGWAVSKPNYLGDAPDQSPIACIAHYADMKSYHGAWEGDDYLSALGNDVKSFIQDNEAFFAFAHVNPDNYGHRFGENSLRYEEEFIRSDALFGELMALINPVTTKVIVISDHGFDEGGNNHYNAPDAFMATNLTISPRYEHVDGLPPVANIRDVAPTIFGYYGLAYEGLLPQIRGKDLSW